MNSILIDLIHEQCKEIIKHMDIQLEYLRTQVNATLGWRLKHHHAEILQELLPVLNPMTEAVTHLQEEIPHCKSSVETLSAELTAKVATFTLAMRAFKHSMKLYLNPILISNRPRLQSTVQHGMA